MTNIDEIAQRLTRMENEARAEWKDIIRRLSRIEASINNPGNSPSDTQSRQQDRWSGALWIGGWAIATGIVAALFVVALLGYLE